MEELLSYLPFSSFLEPTVFLASSAGVNCRCDLQWACTEIASSHACVSKR